MFCLCLIAEPLWAAFTVELDDDEMACLQKVIYFNECSSNPAKLVIWPADEDFASLGIGHAIWYPKGRRGPFLETFPELLLFMKMHGQTLPDWLENWILKKFVRPLATGGFKYGIGIFTVPILREGWNRARIVVPALR